MGYNVFMEQQEALQAKLQQLKLGGSQNLHVVADFDRTLTKVFVEGKKKPSTIALLREGKYLANDYATRAHALFDIYYQFEVSPYITPEEKNQRMQEWWSTHLALMMECGMNKEVIQDIIEKKQVVPREGLFEFMDMLTLHNIPFLIFSAGLGDVIEEFLRSEGKLTPNVYIISNFYEFDEQGKVLGYKSKIIHSCNKKEIELKGTPYYLLIEKRKNILLLGDSLEDIDMTEGIDYDNIIRIGFMNENTGELDKYAQAFDAVIVEDGPMTFVNELIKKVVDLTS
ncbi:MAG: hypothetical protein AABX37_02310, partial [Nanoarchaeota archaeon]